MRREESIAPDYFEALYRKHRDPWGFETSAYEAAKYARTLQALPEGPIGRMLEVGCANGVLTAQLARRCDALLAIDVSETALAAARDRCADQHHVRFEKRRLPQDMPDGVFDVILLSEVVYYLDRADVARTAAGLARATRSGGSLLLVHWLGETDYPLSGDDAVTTLHSALGRAVTDVHAERHEQYRLDLWRRV